MLAVEVDDSAISFNAILHLHVMIEKQSRVIGISCCAYRRSWFLLMLGQFLLGSVLDYYLERANDALEYFQQALAT